MPFSSQTEALKAYQQALELTQKRTSARPADPRDCLELARRHGALGSVLMRIGRYPDAQSHLNEAQAILRQSLQDSPRDLDLRSELSQNQGIESDLLMRSGRPEEALKADRNSIEILDGLVRDYSGRSELRERLAGSTNGLGYHSLSGPTPAEALPVLERAFEGAERLAAESPNQPRYHGLLGLILTNKGNRQMELHHFSEAIKEYERARGYQEQLVRERPTITRYRTDLADTHHNIGLSQVNLGEWESALENFKRASAIYEALIRENPSVTLLREKQCNLLNSTGFALSSHARRRESVPFYEATIEDYRALIREFPTNLEYRFKLARTMNNFGSVWRALGDSERGIDAYRQGCELLKRMVSETKNVFHRYEYAASVSNLAMELDQRGEEDAALAEYSRGAGIYNAVILESPSVRKYRIDLAILESMRGNLLLRSNRTDDSLEAIARALELREALLKEYPDDGFHKSELAVSLIQWARLRIAQGKPEVALDGLKRPRAILDGLRKPKDLVLYNRACLLAQEGAALTALGRSPTDKAEGMRRFDEAIDSLRQAIAQGFNDHSTLTRDLDLDPIRHRDDFQALLADLAFPSDVFQK